MSKPKLTRFERADIEKLSYSEYVKLAENSIKEMADYTVYLKNKKVPVANTGPLFDIINNLFCFIWIEKKEVVKLMGEILEIKKALGIEEKAED